MSEVPSGSAMSMRLRRLRNGKLCFPVERDGEHGWIVFEDGCRPIALVNVEIENGGAGGKAIAAQGEDGHCEVVEDAEARTFVAEGVMRAARQIAAEAALHGIRAAARVPPTEARVRRTSSGDQGKPMRRSREHPPALQIHGRRRES